MSVVGKETEHTSGVPQSHLLQEQGRLVSNGDSCEFVDTASRNKNSQKVP